MAIIEGECVRLGFKSVYKSCYILESGSTLILREFNDLDRVEYELSNNITIDKFKEAANKSLPLILNQERDYSKIEEEFIDKEN